jgi:hypothetical protein
MSAHKVWDPVEKKIYLTTQVRFNENLLPLRPNKLTTRATPDVDLKVFDLEPEVKLVSYDADLMARQMLDEGNMFRNGDKCIIKVKGLTNTYMQTGYRHYLSECAKRAGSEAIQSLNSDLLYQSFYKTTDKPMVLKVSSQAGQKQKSTPLHSFKGLPISIDPTKPPKNYKDAMSRPDAEEWAQAYMEEYNGFIEQGVFEVVYPSAGEKVIGTTTRLDYKFKGDEFDKYKVRMCARGDQQDENSFDPDGLYTPSIKATEVRMLAAIAAHHGLPIYTTDTKQAFLHGTMKQRVLLRPPDWWPQKLEPGQVLLAVKSVYGTKQAPHCWHEEVSQWMVENGYNPVNDEKTIFLKTEPNGDWLINGLYVDDMKHVPSCKRIFVDYLKKYNQRFKTTGGISKLADRFVGLEYEQGVDGIKLHQDGYVRTMLSEFEAELPNPLRTKKVPMSLASEMIEDEEPEKSVDRQKRYRSYVQKLTYLSVWSRPDISYAVGQLSRFGGRAGPSHWEALIHLMGYIKLHPSFKLHYKRGRKGVDPLDGFADSNWNTPLSQLGTIALFNKAPISWKSKRQQSSALSTSEAEYIAVSAAAAEMIYLRRLCKNLNLPMKHPTPIGEDNSGCIEWTNYVIGGRERAKHIDLCKHFAHDAVQNGEIILYKVSSQDQLADFLTKPLSEPLFNHCVGNLITHGAVSYMASRRRDDDDDRRGGRRALA